MKHLIFPAIVILSIIFVVLTVLYGFGAFSSKPEPLTEMERQQLLDRYQVDEMYVITVSVAQKHTILDMDKKVKDQMNKATVALPVMREYYEAAKIGESLEDSFRIGSLLVDGTIGSWDIKIIDKQVITRD